MNWFQIDTFMWWFTVHHKQEQQQQQLWIDFKLILLCDDSQLKRIFQWLTKVVNWFQIDTFMWWFTVLRLFFCNSVRLWIDFKLILLCDDSQCNTSKWGVHLGCELISNWYFYVMIHSYTFGDDIAIGLWIDFKLILLCDDSQ